ncbi:hypothetical protein DFO67_1298 [Modicisalibacter xianhensis]|uniref:Uncharacterized protein n=1 Tax=Modicisalibacter xianhensis TaxID=442341 RepID=A0A4R8FFW3_9GAMM|nr:hypothetical protein [Halomonas xianhensis]TDX22475.1 hypothetical protein DFO67_1298 [Halomonas xianhensis]
MAVTHIAGVAITFPTNEMGHDSAPILSRVSGKYHDVVLRLGWLMGKPVMTAGIHRHDGQTQTQVTLESTEVRLMHEQTLKREIVGLMQPHYAATLQGWLDSGLYDPFTRFSDSRHRQTA